MSELTEAKQQALRTARMLLEYKHPLEEVLQSNLIPAALRDYVREEIERDQSFPLIPARVLVRDSKRPDWLKSLDRSKWHYWPTLREYLLKTKGLVPATLRSLEDTSDRILRQLAAPTEKKFDIRGLVLGYVQSGKTANYTALIAKAADAGYRLVIVLAGIDNGLRLQTNIRLKKELVGYPDNRASSVRLPPVGLQWHEFTSDDKNGDFRPGLANQSSLQGSQPVLLVVKKNGDVLRRLLDWLGDAQSTVRQSLPTLVIDDEADQASVDTRGSYQKDDDPVDPDYEEPAVINGLIRQMLSLFGRCAYVAYTATPYANIFIPHDAVDPKVGNDLYPKDFIIDLPKPIGYFGTEEIFGRMDPTGENEVEGLDVIREVDVADIAALEADEIPDSLDHALKDFVLAGAARMQRSTKEFPATMLVHTSQLTLVQSKLCQLVSEQFSMLRDAWRYDRKKGIREELRERWETEFRPGIRNRHVQRDVSFTEIEKHVGPFLEAVQVLEINSQTGDVLDYENEPNLKAIAIGGNRLSRGLTLEGLLTSYFVRRSKNYDTLMQMGRWFGFREGYEDLTRIYTTKELEDWFADLAYVEHQLRADIEMYESQGLTPYEVGMRIWQHPTMQVTSPLKRRFAGKLTIAQSYSGLLQQTFKFPLNRPEDLASQADNNLAAVRKLVVRLQSLKSEQSDAKGPFWSTVPVAIVLEFLQRYRVDEQKSSISIPLICSYIERLRDAGELTTWIVAVRGREDRHPKLGAADWGLADGKVSQISRTRLARADSLGVITGQGDEEIGLTSEQRKRAQSLVDEARAAGRKKSTNNAAREVRSPKIGLLLLYPISKSSGHERDIRDSRRPLFDNPKSKNARDLVGLGISFPQSSQRQNVEAYLEGTAGWRPSE